MKLNVAILGSLLLLAVAADDYFAANSVIKQPVED